MNILPDTALLEPNPETVFGDVDGEVIALNIDSGNYLHLNTSGSFIFSLLEGGGPKAVEWLLRRVQQEYAVDDATCRREVGTFLARCLELNLIHRVAEPS